MSSVIQGTCVLTTGPVGVVWREGPPETATEFSVYGGSDAIANESNRPPGGEGTYLSILSWFKALRFRPVRNTFVLRHILCALAALLLCSCSSRAPLHPVRGKLFVAGQPADGAVIVFHPANQASSGAHPPPAATVQADGSFTLSTFESGDGAPAGDYVVAVSWLPPDPALSTTQKRPTVALSEKYGDRRFTPLRAKVVAGPNELPPFQLPK